VEHLTFKDVMFELNSTTTRCQSRRVTSSPMPRFANIFIDFQLHCNYRRIRCPSSIQHVTENGLIFEGDSKEIPIDVVILATGYSPDFSFLNSVQEFKDQNRVNQDLNVSPKIYPFYKNTFTPYTENPETLIFIGFTYNSPAIYELQSRWAVALLGGRAERLPTREQMIVEIEKDEQVKKKKFRGAREDERWTWSIDTIPIVACDWIAAKIGAKPNLCKMLFTDPALAKACFLGIWTSYQYRLVGDGKWEGAREAILNYKYRMRGLGGIRIRDLLDNLFRLH